MFCDLCIITRIPLLLLLLLLLLLNAGMSWCHGSRRGGSKGESPVTGSPPRADFECPPPTNIHAFMTTASRSSFVYLLAQLVRVAKYIVGGDMTCTSHKYMGY